MLLAHFSLNNSDLSNVPFVQFSISKKQGPNNYVTGFRICHDWRHKKIHQ
jgi:hypothetical protein